VTGWHGPLTADAAEQVAGILRDAGEQPAVGRAEYLRLTLELCAGSLTRKVLSGHCWPGHVIREDAEVVAGLYREMSG